MEEFSFERVTFAELNIEEESKKKIISDMVTKNNMIKIEEIEKQAIKLIIKKEFGENVTKKLGKLKDKIDELEGEIKNVDYKKHLNEYV